MYNCKILLDSISETGKRLTTMEVTFPRCVLAEAETHRVLRGFGGNVEELIINNLGINVDENLSRNSASSRAIPINRMIQRVKDDPFIPEKWGKPIRGMGAKEYWPLYSEEHRLLTNQWLWIMERAIDFCETNLDIGNKEDLNRVLEPFMYHTAILTATEWDNFFKLRTNEAADWKIRKIADLMYEAYHAFDNGNGNPVNVWSDNKIDRERGLLGEINGAQWLATQPQKLKVGEWHCPLVYEEDFKLVYEWCKTHHYMFNIGNIEQHRIDAVNEYLKKISVARCARVSYLTHDGKRDIEKDLELFNKLVGGEIKHMSPFEHVATPYYDENLWYRYKTYRMGTQYNLHSGNFIGWKQFRKEFADENCTNFRKED